MRKIDIYRSHISHTYKVIAMLFAMVLVLEKLKDERTQRIMLHRCYMN